MKNDVLFLECRGCYFAEDDPINMMSDVGNHRLGSYDYSIKAKDGKNYVIEFRHYDRSETRKTHKKTGKPLKHPKIEITLENGLYIDAQYEDERGTWGNLKLANSILDQKLTFTKDNILKVVNQISESQYKKIVLVSAAEIVKRFDTIRKIGRYREIDILNNLQEVKTREYNNNYWVFTFISESGATFDYEYRSNRITG